MPERVLAVRRHVVALLAHRLVQLRAAVPAHELDARRGVLPRERPQQVEQARVERVAFARHAIGEERREAVSLRA